MPVTLPGTGGVIATKSIGSAEYQQVNRCASGATTTPAMSTAVATLLAANTNRAAFILMNTTGQTLYVRYGAGATTSLRTYDLAAGDYLREEQYTGIVTGILSTGSGNATITELS